MDRPTLSELKRRRQELEQRLTRGWQQIDVAIAAGRDVQAWEELWIALLGEYEQVCDQIRAAEAMAA
jgi:hypothetical protein